MPNMSQTSRSSQLAPGHNEVRESTSAAVSSSGDHQPKSMLVAGRKEVVHDGEASLVGRAGPRVPHPGSGKKVLPPPLKTQRKPEVGCFPKAE